MKFHVLLLPDGVFCLNDTLRDVKPCFVIHHSDVIDFVKKNLKTCHYLSFNGLVLLWSSCSSHVALFGPNVLYQKGLWKSPFILFYISCVLFWSSVLHVKFSCDKKLINLRLITHFELALLYLSDAVKLEKVCMPWVGGFRQKTVVWMHIWKHKCWFSLLKNMGLGHSSRLVDYYALSEWPKWPPQWGTADWN